MWHDVIEFVNLDGKYGDNQENLSKPKNFWYNKITSKILNVRVKII